MNIEEYPETKKWFNRVGRGSIPVYRVGLRLYCDYTKLNPTELIDEVEEDRKKSRREQGIPEQRLMEFHRWLLTECRKRDHQGRETDEVGLAKSKAANYFGAIRSFYKANGFPLSVKTPKFSVKKENQKLNLTPGQAKQLIDHAPTIRDRAIIAMQFQGGFDVSTLCSLNYADVKRELETGIEPLLIRVVRGKDEVEYFTFIGKDSIELLKAYLNERKTSGEELKLDSPLFVKEGYAKKSKQRIATHLIQNMMRDTALRSGIVNSEDLDYSDFNPCRPHALRSAFSTILALNGFNQTLIDFMQGHRVAYNGSYFIPQPEKIREMYRGIESHLSLSEVSRSVGDLEKKLIQVTKEQEREIKELKAKLAEYDRLLTPKVKEELIKLAATQVIQHVKEEFGQKK